MTCKKCGHKKQYHAGIAMWCDYAYCQCLGFVPAASSEPPLSHPVVHPQAVRGPASDGASPLELRLRDALVEWDAIPRPNSRAALARFLAEELQA